MSARNDRRSSISNWDRSVSGFQLPDDMKQSGHETIPQKSALETIRGEYGLQRIPPIAEDADIGHATTSSMGTDSSDHNRTAKITKAKTPRDVLPDKSSWGATTLVG
jgi:hypothetical protein